MKTPRNEYTEERTVPVQINRRNWWSENGTEKEEKEEEEESYNYNQQYQDQIYADNILKAENHGVRSYDRGRGYDGRWDEVEEEEERRDGPLIVPQSDQGSSGVVNFVSGVLMNYSFLKVNQELNVVY